MLYALYSYDKVEQGGATTTGTASISFANKAQRTEKTTTKQVWQQNGITVTNDKAASTTTIGDYANPARFYANSKLTVAYPGMTKIEFTCSGSTYASDLNNSISGVTKSLSGSVVTVTFSDPVDSFVIAKLSKQVRVKSIMVSYSVSSGTPESVTYYTTVIGDNACAHATTSFVEAKEATCLEDGKKADLYCSACKTTLATGTKIDAKGHVEAIDKAAEATCTENGWTEGKHCKRCKEVLVAQEPIDPLKHIEIVDKGTEATCTEPGLTDGKHCDRCKEVLVAQEEIDVLEHADEDGDNQCDDCDATIKDITPSTGESDLVYMIAMSSLLLSALAIALINKKRRAE